MGSFSLVVRGDHIFMDCKSSSWFTKQISTKFTKKIITDFVNGNCTFCKQFILDKGQQASNTLMRKNVAIGKGKGTICLREVEKLKRGLIRNYLILSCLANLEEEAPFFSSILRRFEEYMIIFYSYSLFFILVPYQIPLLLEIK